MTETLTDVEMDLQHAPPVCHRYDPLTDRGVCGADRTGPIHTIDDCIAAGHGACVVCASLAEGARA